MRSVIAPFVPSHLPLRFRAGANALAVLAMTLSVAGADCGTATGITPDGGSVIDEDAGVSNEPDDALSEIYMDEDVMLTVDVTMDPADFDQLRKQARDYFNTFEPGCLTRPFASPFTYFSADVTIGGVPGEDAQTFSNVGIRKKGFFGSVVEDKPSFKIKFDEYEDGVRFFGEKRLTLNNQNQDDALIRTCLAYHVFRQAGVAAPRCNFAVVTVNGVRMGVYANVDAIKKPFLRRSFVEDSGNLYEGTLSDFRPSWSGTFEKKSNEDDAALPEVDALTEALTEDDATLMDSLEGIIDLDAFYTYWAAETLSSHWDGYSGNTNNFYLYQDPVSDKLRFIPWGTDGTFQGPFLLFEDTLAPDSVMASGLLTRRLYGHPDGRAAYLARLDELLVSAWDEDALAAEIDRLHALVAEQLLPAEQAPVDRAIDDVRDFVAIRRGLIEEERVDGPISWDVPLREDICLTNTGEVDFTFSTTWGTHPAPLFQYESAGTATFDGTLFGDPLEPTTTGSGAGIEDNGNEAGWTVVLATGGTPGAPTGYFYFQIAPGLAEEGAVLEVDGENVRGFLFIVAPTFQVIGGFYEGALTLDTFSTEADAPVSGTFSGFLAGDTGE